MEKDGETEHRRERERNSDENIFKKREGKEKGEIEVGVIEMTETLSRQWREQKVSDSVYEYSNE